MQKVRVHLKEHIDKSYDILIGSGIMDNVASDLKKNVPASSYIIITDTNVEKLYAKKFLRQFVENGLNTSLIPFPAGEQSKTQETKSKIDDELIDLETGRDAAVIAFGGGVVGDVAGFVSATFMRGIPFVQVPTTLLAQVDSSIGGKVAIDHPLGKNMIGAFHQPKKVFIDIDTLKTLPKKEIENGLAEIIKHSIIKDREFFNFLAKNVHKLLRLDKNTLTKAIKKSCEIKARIVELDEKESGLRKMLNFGHTIGHAVEALSNYKLPHGLCVSIGMAAESEIAVMLGLLKKSDLLKIKSLLNIAGLPVRLPGYIRIEDIIKKSKLDNKARAGKVEYVLPVALGKAKHGIAVEDEIVSEALGKLK